MFWKTQRSSNKSPIQLENENKQLQLNIMTLTDQLENFKKICYKYQEEYNKLVKRVNSFCRMLLDKEYAQSQLGGNNFLSDMDIFTLIDYAEQNYRNNMIKERDLFIELTNQLKSKEQEIEGLKAQISRYMLKEQQSKEFGLEQDVTPAVDSVQEPAKNVVASPNENSNTSVLNETQKVFSASTPKGITKISIIEDEEDEGSDSNSTADQFLSVETRVEHTGDSVSEQDREKDLKNVESSHIISKTHGKTNDSIAEELIQIGNQSRVLKKDNDVVAHVIDLKDYADQITDIMWEIIVAIGKDGLSESKDLKKAVVKDNVTESAFNTALAQLRRMNIVNQERINTGWRWFHVHELSDLGNRLYFEKFKKEPVACEKQILQREHTTALHGYCIKDAAYILRTVLGYDETVTDRKINSIKLYNGEVYIPDIVAKKKQGSIVDYFEVELGHHTQKDFNSKCDKMRMVTKDLYFIVPDADTMNKILARQIGQWVLEKGGKEKLKGTTIYLTTMTKLNDGKWESVYPF